MRKTDRTAGRLAKLAELFAGRGTLLIALQDGPDPDALAAAMALRELANTLAGIHCSMVHGGTIGRAENRALVEYLDLPLRPLDGVDLARFDLTAMVDTQPGAGNNSFPPDRVPDIVVDHHPIRRATRSVPFTDIRRNYGATATILWEYLAEADVAVTPPLATALLYGIRSDTQDLGREASQADIDAIEALYPLANKRMLGQIQRGRVPGAYFQMLNDALRHAMVYGRCVLTNLGQIDNPDMIAEVADLLLRHEHVHWALCAGHYDGKMIVSVRTTDAAGDAGAVMRRIVSRLGAGGGHAAMAGGQIPLRKDTQTYRRALEKKIRDRYLRALGQAEQRGVRLVRDNGA